MKTIRAILVLVAVLVVSGCATSRTYRLPPIAADEISVTHTDWFGSISARGTDMRVTERYITWATAEWEVMYGGWHDKIIAKNYRQRREDTPSPTPTTVPALLQKP